MNRSIVALVAVGVCVSSQGAIVALPNGAIYGTYLPATNSSPFRYGALGSSLQFRTNAAIVQTQSTADNHTIVTADAFGGLRVWVYANAFLGYVDAATDTLLYCEPLSIFGQQQPLVEAWGQGSIGVIQDTWVYPGSSQRVNGTNGKLFNPDGSVLRNEAGRWRYKESGREIDWHVGEFTGYDDREDFFYWHNGHFINEPVSLWRFYENGDTLVDPAPDPVAIPFSRNLRYTTGALFATGGEVVKYPDGSDLIVREPGRFLLKYPPPFASINLADIRAGGFALIRYSNGDVLKQDVAPWSAQLRRTDGTLTSGTTNAFGFPGGISLYVSANQTRDFIGIYREDANSVAAYLQLRQPPANPRNLRVVNVTESTVSLAWDVDPAGNNVYRVAAIPEGESSSGCSSSGAPITELTTTLRDLLPNKSYDIELCQQSAPASDYFNSSSTLASISTRPVVVIQRSPTLVVSAVSNSAGRYRLEQSAELVNWVSAGGLQASPSGPSVLNWPLPAAAGRSSFFRVRKLTPFEPE